MNIANHPGAFLNDAAAASFERLEAARGIIIPVSDFGRSEAYQQELIDRWDRGDRENLFEPGRPASASPHVRNGGEAADVIDPAARAWIKAHPEFGWSFTIPSDIVHMVYDASNDEFRGQSTPASGGLASVINRMEQGMTVAITTPEGVGVLIFPGGELPLSGAEGSEIDGVSANDRNVGGVVDAVWGKRVSLNGTDVNTVLALNRRMTAILKSALK